MATGAHRWRQIEELYHAALEREPGDRAALLAGADPDVRREVESLLSQPTADFPLSEPVVWKRPGRRGARAEHPAHLDNSPAALRAAGPAQTPSDLSTGLTLDPLDDARFAPGRIFASRYRIVNLLGRGAMGEVYRADDLRLEQIVALKLMSEAMARRGDGLERLAAEVRPAPSSTQTSAVCTTSGTRKAGTTCRWSTSTARRWRRCCGASDSLPCGKRSRWRGNCARALLPLTIAAYCIAI